MTVRYVVSALAAVFLLAGCSSGSEERASSPTPPTAGTEQSNAEGERDEPQRSPRGYVMKEIGEQGGIGLPDDPETNWISFTVNEIAEGESCDSYESPTGVPTRVEVAIATADVPEEYRLSAGALFNPGSWQWVQADGTTSGVNAQEGNFSYSCGTWSQLASGLASNSQYRATLVLDVPQGATNLILHYDGGGWEWELP